MDVGGDTGDVRDGYEARPDVTAPRVQPQPLSQPLTRLLHRLDPQQNYVRKTNGGGSVRHTGGESEYTGGESEHTGGESEHTGGESEHTGGESEHTGGESEHTVAPCKNFSDFGLISVDYIFGLQCKFMGMSGFHGADSSSVLN